MWGPITRMFAGRASTRPADPLAAKRAEIEAACIAQGGYRRAREAAARDAAATRQRDQRARDPILNAWQRFG